MGLTLKSWSKISSEGEGAYRSATAFLTKTTELVDKAEKQYNEMKSSTVKLLPQRAYKKADDWMAMIKVNKKTIQSVYNGMVSKYINSFRNLVKTEKDRTKADWYKGQIEKGNKQLLGHYQQIVNKVERLNGERSAIGKSVRGLNKVNPLLSSGRNAYLGLLKVNFLNFAGQMGKLFDKKNESDKNKKAYNKVKNFWEGIGGDWSALQQATKVGRNKKAATTKSGFTGEKYSNLFGVDDAIAGTIIVAICGLLASVTASIGGNNLSNADQIQLQNEAVQSEVFNENKALFDPEQISDEGDTILGMPTNTFYWVMGSVAVIVVGVVVYTLTKPKN